MKHVQKNKIINISENKPSIFLFEYLHDISSDIKIIDMAVELEKYKNSGLLDQTKTKPAIWGNVYAPEDELKIFTDVFEQSISNNTRIHIVGITLKEELEILEKYYHDMGYFSEDINCYTPDFQKCLVTVSVNIENLMWRGSDYKRMGKEIFFNPPIRESGQVKALFKGINRGVVAGINFGKLTQEKNDFLTQCIIDEKILPITLAKTLKYNIEDIGFTGKNGSFEMEF